ncbi:hypothetical protein M5689_009626 [Euphorbia peplus]|nr:hypothetical protein M5689_009626 [Euphorbia peplus]
MKLLLLFSLLVLFFISTTGEVEMFRPVEIREYKVIEETSLSWNGSLSRRRLEPYQLCLLCKCCTTASTCATMSCCFGIDCGLPNKPYGVCAFVPKTCNCTSCAT